MQDALEDIVFHLIRYLQKETGHRKLCLAGGVAHNCTLNGKILYSALFDDVFVQPASHDGGLALGGALFAYYNGKEKKDKRIEEDMTICNRNCPDEQLLNVRRRMRSSER